MQNMAKILALNVALWIGVVPLFAQLQPGGNPFHSPFEAAVVQSARSGDTADALSLFLCGHPATDAALVAAYRQRLDAYTSEILADSRAQGRADALFRGLRSRLFQRYTPIADVHGVLQTGEFNCVSATALMAIAYESAGIGVEVHEQPRHVFLYAVEGGHRLRVESTAADFGAIREGRNKAVSGKPSRANSASQAIPLVALAGLQYYNQGLAALDRGQAVEAVDAFRKAELLYPSPRVREMLPIAALACKKAGMLALARHDWEAALHLLERAAGPDEDAALDLALSAAVLAQSEAKGDWQGMLTVLRAYAEWRPGLCRQAAFGASYADALLANAAHAFTGADAQAAFDGLKAFENLYSDFGCQPDPQIASQAYQAGYRAAVRTNALDLAEHCLLMGLRLAPSDLRLQAQLATFSQQ
jgi:tetratricopeptide (TPR) repeat protein